MLRDLKNRNYILTNHLSMLEVLHPSNGPRMDLYQSRDLANESPVYHAYDEARRALLTIQQLLGGEVKSGDVEVLEGWINNELPAQY